MNVLWIIAIFCGLALQTASGTAQSPPDLSGVWRLLPDESRMVGGGGPPSDEYRLTWLIDHRDPEISVVVEVRDAAGSHEFVFRCTTDGRECVNELPSIQEVRRMTAAWEGDVLVMSQQSTGPRGGFQAEDRISLSDSGERLVFERIVVNAADERSVTQVFQKLGPHPARRVDPRPRGVEGGAPGNVERPETPP